MSRILLISSNTTVEPFPVYPLGMALVAAALEKKGHTVRQFDVLVEQEAGENTFESAIRAFDPAVIGISIRNIDNVDSLTSDWYLDDVKAMVKRIRSVTGTPVVLGGPAFSIMPETILSFTGADYGIAGEGEETFAQLIQALENGQKPPALIPAAEKQISGSAFSAPLHDPVMCRYYLDQTGLLNYQTKRGCPHTCNYCSYPLIEGRVFRPQEPEFVAENLIRMKKDFGVDSVFFTDSVFNDSKGHYLEVAQAMIEKECNVKWAAYFRPDSISDKDLKLLKKSGLYAMEIGSDAACDTTLEGIGKTFDFSKVTALNDACGRQEIACAHFFMFGGPKETPATIKEGLENIRRLEKCVVFAFSSIRILPGTGLQQIAIDEGIISADDDLLHPVYYTSPAVDKAGMEDEITCAFKNNKNRIFPPEEGQIKVNALKMFGLKGLLWNMLLETRKKGRKRNPIKRATRRS